MNNYQAPEIKVTVFDNAEDVICASAFTKITGGGGGMELPDDEFET